VLGFLEKKAGGYEPLRYILALLAADLPRGKYMAFCSAGAVGVPLKREFDAWCNRSGAKHKVQRAAWNAFAEETIRRDVISRLEHYMLPHGCELPIERQRIRFRRHRGQLSAWEPDDLIQAHFGDETFLPVLKEQVCGGCHRNTCPHHLRYSEDPPTLVKNEKPEPPLKGGETHAAIDALLEKMERSKIAAE
jgi:hypothetical protein